MVLLILGIVSVGVGLLVYRYYRRMNTLVNLPKTELELTETGNAPSRKLTDDAIGTQGTSKSGSKYLGKECELTH